MVKRVIWTNTAKNQRTKILQFWFKKNGSKSYSKKVSKQIRKRIKYIALFNHLGKVITYNSIRVATTGHFSLFYKL